MEKGLFFMFFYLLLTTLSSQNNVKYCFCESIQWNGEKLSSKEQVINAIKDKHRIHVNKTGDIWSNIVNSNFIEDRDNKNIPIAIDSSDVWCKIINITKKTDNYAIKGNKLIPCPIYLIDIECDNEDSVKSSSYMRIISISSKKKEKHGVKVEIGQTYRLYLISYFEKDCCKIIIDDKAIDVVKGGPNTQICFILNHIWVVNLDLYYNWYKTTNLQGLYYVPSNAPATPRVKPKGGF